MEKNELGFVLECDKKVLGRNDKKPAFFDWIWKYEISLRKCEYYYSKPQNLFGKILKKHWFFRYKLLGNLLGIEIPLYTCGKGLCIPHLGGIVINENARLGDFCRIYQNVTIGVNVSGCKNAPHIGNYVVIYSGSRIVGDVGIGDNCAVGANSFVNKDFSEYSNVTLGGIPAKIISEKGNQSYNSYSRIKECFGWVE